MIKNIGVEFSKFNNYPTSLSGVSNIQVNIIRLCHHMYLDSYGANYAVPNPNPDFLKYSDFVAPCPDLRFRHAVGDSKETRTGEYNRFGRAFCRWFLDEHFNISYFHPIEKLLNGQIAQNNNFRVARVKTTGDSPDYLCADSAGCFLAEAKGSSYSIKFGDKKFDKWRDQFKTVGVYDSTNVLRRIKGYIVATRIVNQSQCKTFSKIYAEDPFSPGHSEPDKELNSSLRELIIAGHYGNILEKLGLKLFAAGLNHNFPISAEGYYPVGIWRCRLPQMEKIRFVGGFFADYSPIAIFPVHPWQIARPIERYYELFGFYLDKCLLHLPKAKFFGLWKAPFDLIVNDVLRGKRRNLLSLENFPKLDKPLPEDFSLLNDGSVLAPLDYFELENIKII